MPKICIAVYLIIGTLLATPFVFVKGGLNAVRRDWILGVRAFKGWFPPCSNK